MTRALWRRAEVLFVLRPIKQMAGPGGLEPPIPKANVRAWPGLETGVQEKRDIRAEVAKKGTSYYAAVTSGKHNEKEYKALKPKVDKFFKDRP